MSSFVLISSESAYKYCWGHWGRGWPNTTVLLGSHRYGRRKPAFFRKRLLHAVFTKNAFSARKARKTADVIGAEFNGQLMTDWRDIQKGRNQLHDRERVTRPHHHLRRRHVVVLLRGAPHHSTNMDSTAVEQSATIRVASTKLVNVA